MTIKKKDHKKLKQKASDFDRLVRLLDKDKKRKGRVCVKTSVNSHYTFDHTSARLTSIQRVCIQNLCTFGLAFANLLVCTLCLSISSKELSTLLPSLFSCQERLTVLFLAVDTRQQHQPRQKLITAGSIVEKGSTG